MSLPLRKIRRSVPAPHLAELDSGSAKHAHQDRLEHALETAARSSQIVLILICFQFRLRVTDHNPMNRAELRKANPPSMNINCRSNAFSRWFSASRMTWTRTALVPVLVEGNSTMTILSRINLPGRAGNWIDFGLSQALPLPAPGPDGADTRRTMLERVAGNRSFDDGPPDIDRQIDVTVFEGRRGRRSAGREFRRSLPWTSAGPRCPCGYRCAGPRGCCRRHAPWRNRRP